MTADALITAMLYEGVAIDEVVKLPLFHGTTLDAAQRILRLGLQKGSYVTPSHHAAREHARIIARFAPYLAKPRKGARWAGKPTVPARWKRAVGQPPVTLQIDRNHPAVKGLRADRHYDYIRRRPHYATRARGQRVFRIAFRTTAAIPPDAILGMHTVTPEKPRGPTRAKQR